MTALTALKTKSISVCLVSASLLLVGQVAAQTRSLNKLKRVIPKTDTSQPQPDNNTQPNNNSQPDNNSQPVGESPAKAKDSSTAAAHGTPPNLLSYFVSEIEDAKKDAEIYDPAERLYLVKARQQEWLLQAVSPRARTERAAKSKYTEWRQANPNNELDAALDQLAEVARKKLLIYKPDPVDFKFRNPVAEKLLMSNFKNTATMKIHRIGVSSAGWEIQKDSSGYPSYRYKDANVYFRDSSDDHAFCHVVSTRVKQDYAGGGTYSTETYQSSSEDELFGCP